MDMFLRCAAANSYAPNRFFTRAYDSRLLYILAGSGVMHFEDCDYEIKPDALFYYPAGTKYYPQSSKKDPIYFVTLNFDFTREFEQNRDILAPLPIKLFNEKLIQPTHLANDVPHLFRNRLALYGAGEFRDIATKIVREAESDGEYSNETAEALLNYFCLKLANQRKPKNQSTLFSAAQQYINENLASISKTEDIATALSYHPYYLSRIFKTECGMPLHKYLISVRLKRGAALLASTDLSVKDISQAVGFCNSDHFSKRFSQNFGTTPTAYRRAHRTPL